MNTDDSAMASYVHAAHENNKAWSTYMQHAIAAIDS